MASLTSSNMLQVVTPDPSGAGGLAYNDNFISLAALGVDGITGLHTSNGTDTSHDIDITVGAATDSTNANVLVLGTAITKQIDASWSVGTAAGGLDTGSVSTSTWYAIFLIKRSDTGVVDALFSTSFTSPTMPTNYDYKRYIGAVLTDASANILAYKQIGDVFELEQWVYALDDSTPTTIPTDVRAVCPPILCQAICQGLTKTTTSSDRYLEIHHAGAASTRMFITTAGNPQREGATFTQITNDSGEIRYSANNTSDWAQFSVTGIGWIDPRGRAVG